MSYHIEALGCCTRFIWAQYDLRGVEHSVCELRRRGGLLVTACSITGELASEEVFSTASDVDLPCYGEDKSQLWVVVRRRYWAREQRFETLLSMRHKLPVGWHNIEIFTVMLSGSSGMSTLLRSWRIEYECSHILFLPNVLIYTNFCDLYPRGNTKDIRLVITLASFGLGVLPGVQLLFMLLKRRRHIIILDHWVSTVWWQQFI